MADELPNNPPIDNDRNIVFETPSSSVSELPFTETANIEFEKYKLKMNLFKWILGTFAITIITLIINWGFKDRAVGMHEISQYDRYATELIVLNDNPVKKRMLAQFFAYVTPSAKLRDGWNEYYAEVDKEYEQFMSETRADKNRLLQLQKIDTAKLSNAQKNEIKVLQPIVQLKESIINAPLLVPQTSSNYSNIKAVTPLKFVKTNSKRPDLAKQFEDEGFAYLLNKDIDNAIISFTKSENSYNGYHMVYDIAIYLNKMRDQLSVDNIENWKSVYSIILSKYNWKMPEKYKSKLQEQSN